MAVYFKTSTPRKLLAAFKKAIDDGKVVTWSYDKDGDFTHTADQWKNKAWMTPEVEQERALKFLILNPKGIKVSSEVYAIYHGRIIESFLVHCDQLFDQAEATALATIGDKVKPQ